MSTRTPAHGSERYLDFTNAQGLCFRMQVEDDPHDACAFTVRVTPLQGHGEPDASQRTAPRQTGCIAPAHATGEYT